MSTFIELQGSLRKGDYSIDEIVYLIKTSGQERVDLSTHGQQDDYGVNFSLFLSLGERTFWAGEYTPARDYTTYTQRMAAVERVALCNAIEIAGTIQTPGLEVRIDDESIDQASKRIAKCDDIINEGKIK